ncbi:NAD(P)H:quinone oxidoreductase [Gudongella sp. DL1XJH-153]|uniref:NAD(P)H:quinone oxidoreductase n=1 Tax=Gudongella sp. DL1XJH-153 TaxID=3409804 RepID=UPI003BB54907
MEKVKFSIIYYSANGANYKMAKWAEEAAKETGAEVRLAKVPELIPQEVIDNNPKMKEIAELTKDVPIATSDDLEWSDAIVFSTGTRFGNVTSQMKNFFDMQGGLWAEGKLANKVVSAMSSAQNPHGGQEETIQAMYTTFMHWGAIIAAPGYTDNCLFPAGGNPYGTSTSVSQEGEIMDDIEAAVKHQARRTIQIAEWIKKGQ